MARFLLPLSFLSLLCVGGAWQAQAQSASEDNMLFMATDVNHDGTVTEDEARQRIAQDFSRYDPNRDGQVTYDELISVMIGPAAITSNKNPQVQASLMSLRFMHNGYDTNGDRSVTVQEYINNDMRMFKTMDINGDGKIPFKEYTDKVEDSRGLQKR